MSSIYVPDGILFKILYQLPVKTLIKFTCVCKTWRLVITHPDFISKHLHGRENKDGYAMYCWINSSNGPLHTYIFHKNMTTYVLYANPKIPFSCKSSHFAIVGSVNGLLLLTDSFHFGQTIYLWNPSIWKLKILTETNLWIMQKDLTVGLGHHRQTNDYMVVRIMHIRHFCRFQVPSISTPPQVELYSLTKNSWRKIETNLLGEVFVGSQKQHSTVFTNGAVHWIAHKTRGDARYTYFVWKFNFESQEFGEIMLPEYDRDVYVTEISVLRESFSVIACCFNDYYIKHCDIWVMMEYGMTDSWTKQYTVVAPEQRCERCLGIINHNELLLLMAERRNIVSYDLETKQFKHVGIGDHKGDWEDWSDFTDNLVLYNEGIRLTPQKHLLLEGAYI